mmetsp:Transcript_5351/g.7345  ORF Transcript_5351/g.7345 Transcript_5351/m.7345 type:complete len:249 (-) Transcript_5351:42-788(-)|eukprot:CAMPEP_0185736102 /NCGR_PEP_ID=MMETSP1171-20130828/26907_1 /TAXON_ID=374046 /ORGANISM="Helicotheca tamensis, Strain CCMP826" /LENGTH=248 /DNA_ID=CAMNT_0028406611 /DNA_START=221 /DNA_END=967 /DNA_ORIENTATION=+
MSMADLSSGMVVLPVLVMMTGTSPDIGAAIVMILMGLQIQALTIVRVLNPEVSTATVFQVPNLIMVDSGIPNIGQSGIMICVGLKVQGLVPTGLQNTNRRVAWRVFTITPGTFGHTDHVLVRCCGTRPTCPAVPAARAGDEFGLDMVSFPICNSTMTDNRPDIVYKRNNPKALQQLSDNSVGSDGTLRRRKSTHLGSAPGVGPSIGGEIVVRTPVAIISLQRRRPQEEEHENVAHERGQRNTHGGVVT